MTDRLPVLGGSPRDRGPAPQIGPREPCDGPTLAVVGAARAISVAPFVAAFEQAARQAGAEVAVEGRVQSLHRCVPRLAVLITGGLLPAAWDPDVRALEGTFDLVLSEPRLAVARGLAAVW